jgi:hypothetical protein
MSEAPKNFFRYRFVSYPQSRFTLFFLTSGLELIHIVSLPAYRTPVAVQLTRSALSHVHLPLWHLSIRSTLHRTFHCHNDLDELISPAVPEVGTNPALLRLVQVSLSHSTDIRHPPSRSTMYISDTPVPAYP